MGYHLSRLDEPVFMTGAKHMQTEFGIHHRLESCSPACFRFLALCCVLVHPEKLTIWSQFDKKPSGTCKIQWIKYVFQVRMYVSSTYSIFLAKNVTKK